MTAAAGFAAAAPAAAHVFVADVRNDDDVRIEGEDGHHLQRVRRLNVGELVTASDGRGSWRLYEIGEAAEGGLRLAPCGPLTFEPQLTPRVVVAFAPAKGDQAGAVVHQLVELGVDGLMPVTLHRSVVRWDGPRGDKSRGRLTKVIREAAMQSRRARLPELMAALPLSALTRHRGLLVADPDGEPAPLLRLPDGGEWLAVVGPEGGLDPTERAELGTGARLSVGPHVLRAVTAPVAVAAALVGFRTTRGADSSDSSDSTV